MRSLGTLVISPPVPEGQRIMISVLLACSETRVFPFERKDASFFFPPKSRHMALHGMSLGPGTHHKDICVSFGLCGQAQRLPRLSAHLPYGGQSPSFCQPKATGRLSGNRDSLAAAAAAAGLAWVCDLRPPRPLAAWLPASGTTRLERPGQAASFDRQRGHVWPAKCVVRANQQCLLCWESLEDGDCFFPFSKCVLLWLCQVLAAACLSLPAACGIQSPLARGRTRDPWTGSTEA